MYRSIVLVASVVGLSCYASLAAAHTTLTYPPPRTLANKISPCGEDGSGRGDTVTSFRPGETITVTWDETIDHPGHYRIALDNDGEDDFALPNNPDDDFAVVLVDQIADRAGGGLYSQQVTLPDMECDNCTLQLIQIMTTRVPYNSFYFQCADLKLTTEPTVDAGPEGSSEDGGCGVGGPSRPGAALLLCAVLLGLRRARSRSPGRN